MHFSTKTKKNSCPKITQACSAWLCFRPSRHNFELSPICCEAQAIPPAQAYRVNCWPLPKNKKSFFLEKNVPKNCTSWTHSGCVVIMFATPVFFNRKKMLSHAQVARRYHRSNLHRMTPLSNLPIILDFANSPGGRWDPSLGQMERECQFTVPRPMWGMRHWICQKRNQERTLKPYLVWTVPVGHDIIKKRNRNTSTPRKRFQKLAEIV